MGIADPKLEFPTLRATRRRVPVSSEFFQVGDVEREFLAKQLIFCVQSAPNSPPDVKRSCEPSKHNTDNSRDETQTSEGGFEVNPSSREEAQKRAPAGSKSLPANQLDEKQTAHTLYCPVAGCKKWFSHTQDLEDHYNSIHVAACSICHKCFPSQRLLNLHVAETHDSFFQAKAAAGAAMYECLVESCTARFACDSDRHRHLVDRHKYPPSFSFHSRSNPSQRRRKKLAAGTTERGRESRGGESHTVGGSSSIPDNGESLIPCEDLTGQVSETTEVDRKEMTCQGGEMSMVPCTGEAVSSGQEGVEEVSKRTIAEDAGQGRFCKGVMDLAGQHSAAESEIAGSDSAGAATMEVECKEKETPLRDTGHYEDMPERHLSSAGTKARKNVHGTAMDIDAEVEKLTGALQQMSSNFVPRAVSFGRRRAPGVTRVPAVHRNTRQSDKPME